MVRRRAAGQWRPAADQDPGRGWVSHPPCALLCAGVESLPFPPTTTVLQRFGKPHSLSLSFQKPRLINRFSPTPAEPYHSKFDTNFRPIAETIPDDHDDEANTKKKQRTEPVPPLPPSIHNCHPTSPVPQHRSHVSTRLPWSTATRQSTDLFCSSCVVLCTD